LRIHKVLYERKKKVPTLGIETGVKREEEEKSTISIEDFKKVDLCVGKVVEVEDLPDTKKLYKLKVDIGDSVLTLVAGLKEHYTPEELRGKNVVVVKNLKKAKIRNVISEGMLLAASSDGVLAVLTVDRDVKPGSQIS